MNDFLNGFGIVVGVIAGTVAGTGVMLLAQFVSTRRQETQKVAALAFEIEFNVQKVDSWLDLLVDFRNAVSTNNPAIFVGYFDLTQLLFAAANDMLASGLLYRYLSHDHIRRFKLLSSRVTIYYENQINQDVQKQKQAFNQTEASNRILFWETSFKEHREALQVILSHLQSVS